MGERIPQSTAYLVEFKAYLSSDHVTEATGKTIAITISKNGGAFGNPAAGATNATEISGGWYKVALGTGDTDTLGPLLVRGAVATIDDYGERLTVVSATTMGATNLDAAVSSRMATYTQPTGFLAATFPSDPADQSLVIAATDALATLIGDVPTNAELATSQAAADDATLAAISALDGKIDTIDSNVDAILVDTAEIGAAGAGLTNINLPNQTMDIVGNITGNLSGSVGSVTGLTASNLDAAISTRASQTSVDDLPTNSELATALGTADDAVLAQIALIKAVSDKLSPTASAIGRGTVTSGASTTSVPTSAFLPAGAVADQFKGRVILFDATTTTTTLRGTASTITASSNASTPTFTVDTLPATPQSGDTFSIV